MEPLSRRASRGTSLQDGTEPGGHHLQIRAAKHGGTGEPPSKQFAAHTKHRVERRRTPGEEEKVGQLHFEKRVRRKHL